MFYWMPPSERWKGCISAMEMWSCLIVSIPISCSWLWFLMWAGMHQALVASKWGHLTGPLSCWDWDCRGIITARSCFRGQDFPYPRGCRHLTVFLCTQPLLKENEGRLLALSGLAPSPGSSGAKAWCMLGVSIQAQEGASNRNGRPRIWNRRVNFPVIIF